VCHSPFVLSVKSPLLSISKALVLRLGLGFLAIISNLAQAAPTQYGQTGLVNMPSARIDDEGTLRFGLGHMYPYQAFWSSLSIFSRLELGARYTSINGVDTGDGEWENYGVYKDKAFDAKLMLWRESEYLPEISVGTQDFLGTRILDANYIVLNKQFGKVDFSLGYGENRIDGYFGGLRYQPEWNKDLSLVYEYDAFDYEHDFNSTISGAEDRKGGSTFALEYRYGWLGSQVALQDDNWGWNVYVSIPLMQKEFVPKIHEPPPMTEAGQRVSIEQWRADPKYQAALVSALEAQGYRNVRLALKGKTLQIGFSHRRITLVGRAVGRAARTALLMGPHDMQKIEITYFTLLDLALVTYEFNDLPQLEDFFAGKVTYGDLLHGLVVSYADPAVEKELAEQPSQFDNKKTDDGQTDLQWVSNEEGHALSLRQDDKRLGRFRLIPFNMGVFFNDKNGAFRYEIFSLAVYSKHLDDGLFFSTSARLSLLEDVSEVSDESNSLLPHVRSDVAEYKRASRGKLNTLMLNKFLHLQPRVYARGSIGYYEEMYAGMGGQILYLPKQSHWATDLTVDWVRQREFGAGLGFRPYKTVTALAAFHYQIPKYGVTFTLRGGRFLARDKGIRYEFQRRFRSGVRIGAWYTVTDGNDITSPGTPDDPYYDKGIFMSIPLGSMLTKDTRATGRFAIAPWTRDVGQMVYSPGDLYTILEDPLMLDWAGYHLLSGFHQ
jgi:hypothetical protein